MANPLISVIIPTYNRTNYITQAINSVLRQTYMNFEIIVVDDGSIDNTKEIVASYVSGILKYVFQENSGPSAARNMGIRLARGEYIAFLDSDDLWDPQKLEIQTAMFRDDPALGIVFSNVRYVDGNDKIIRDSIAQKGYEFSGDYIKETLEIRFPFPSSSAVMIKKEVVEEVGLFDESLRLGEDGDLWLRTAFLFKVGYIKRPLVSVRMHRISLIHQTTASNKYISALRVYERYRKEIERRRINFDACAAKFFSSAGNHALLKGERLGALAFYLQALSRTPMCFKRYKDLARCILPLSYLKRRHDFVVQSP